MDSSFGSLIEKVTSRTSTTDLYRVDNSNREITMNLLVGAPGQKAVSRIKLGDQTLADAIDGAIASFPLGSNASLNNKFLKVRTIITDVQQTTNDTAVNFSLSGGPEGKYHCNLFKTVASDGDSVIYEIEIFFFT